MDKILLFDIETAPSLGYVWGKYQQDVLDFEKDWYVLCFAAKWLGEKKIYTHALVDYKLYKKDPENDFMVVSQLWKYFNEADVVVAHNCVEKSTPVLKQDLTWVPAGDLKRGDEIVGFEEAIKPNETFRDRAGKWRGTKDSVRRIKPTEVLSNKIEKQYCLEVELSNGDKITTTQDHFWLGKTKKDNFYKWIKTEDLKPGFRFTKFWNVWSEDRSIEKIDWANFGGLKGKNLETVEVVRVSPVGEKEVAVISTGEKTFFAGGYAMHNCDAFDVRKANARFIVHELNPPSPFYTVDTLKAARRNFKLDSNKLDDLGRYLGVGRKEDVGSFRTWKKCMKGDPSAWKKMVKYNKKDVQLLESVYLKLRPWIHNHPNVNVIDDENPSCRNCGSCQLQRRGTKKTVSGLSYYQTYWCRNCGKWGKGRTKSSSIQVQ